MMKNNACLMMMALFATLLIAGCSTEEIPKTSKLEEGQSAPPPEGHTEYCKRNPEGVKCQSSNTTN